jgi:hypothetical protein
MLGFLMGEAMASMGLQSFPFRFQFIGDGGWGGPLKKKHTQIQWEIFRILKWRYVKVPYFWPYFVGIFPYIGLIYGRYLQFRFLRWPLTNGNFIGQK